MARAEDFLADIIEHPDDDAPRLIFADWLDDHGQPERADLIRSQCALASGSVAARRRAALTRHVDELLRRHELEWTKPLHGIVQRARFARGFVERVTLRGEDFVRRGAALFELAPVRHVILTEAREPLERIVASRALTRVQTLEFRDASFSYPDHVFYRGRIEVLRKGPSLPRLRGLILRFGLWDNADAHILARWPGLATLETLDLYDCRLGVEGVTALARTRTLGSLRSLVLSHNYIGDESVEALVGLDSCLTGLKELSLADCGIGDGAARWLADMDDVLERLDLRGNQIRPAAQRKLTRLFGERVRF
jgi:uncharacterized protein (TIGR02996 family)